MMIMVMVILMLLLYFPFKILVIYWIPFFIIPKLPVLPIIPFLYVPLFSLLHLCFLKMLFFCFFLPHIQIIWVSYFHYSKIWWSFSSSTSFILPSWSQLFSSNATLLLLLLLPLSLQHYHSQIQTWFFVYCSHSLNPLHLLHPPTLLILLPLHSVVHSFIV